VNAEEKLQLLTPLHLAAARNDAAAADDVACLLSVGSDTTARDSAGLTAAERARKAGREDIATALQRNY